MKYLFGQNNNGQGGSGLGNAAANVGKAASNVAKSWWHRIPLPLRLKIIGIGAAVIAGALMLIFIIATIYNVFHGGFSTITGTEPTQSEISQEDKDNGVDQTTEGFDGGEVEPGLENATEIMNSYYDEDGNSAIGEGLEKLQTCTENFSLKNWFYEKFTGNAATACSLIKMINEEATKKEKKYSTYELEIDRGLIISTFIYAYANITFEDGSNELLNQYISAADPFTILTYLVEGATIEGENGEEIKFDSNIKINRDDVEGLVDAQIMFEDNVSLTWGVIQTNDYYTTERWTETNAAGETVEKCKETLDYSDRFYGCKSKENFDVKFSLDKYKIYLRDMTKNIPGYAPTNPTSGGGKDVVKAYDNNDKPVMKYDTTGESEHGLSGYVGANSFDQAVKTSTGYCLQGEPVLSGNDGLARHSETYYRFNTCDGDVAKTTGQFVEMEDSQAFIKNILDSKLNDKSGFLTKADYSDINKEDNFNFTYNNQTFKIDYNKGFINKKFDFISEEQVARLKYKNIEGTIDMIVNNAIVVNKALNFRYHEEEIEVSNNAIVLGNEAAVLGDYDWVVTSEFGYRTHPIEGYTHLHKGVDLAGYQIGGKGIYAWKDGKVIFNDWYGSGGWTVKIQHESLEGKKVVSFYMHMRNQSTLKVGDTITAGTLVGQVGTTGGSTGDHLHFQIEIEDTAVDPCDYMTVGKTC